MSEIFARYLTPLTYVMWAMIIAGEIDHFAIGFLPREIANVSLYIMWPLLAFVWFGHRHNTRMKAQATRDDLIDDA